MKQFKLFIIIFFPIISFSQENWIIDNKGCKMLNPSGRKIRSFNWTGECIDSLAEGKGQIARKHFIRKSKVIFEGSMLKGKAEDSGICMFSKNTKKQEGIFKGGYFYEGTKTYMLGPKLWIYKGKFINNELTGEGELIMEGVYKHIGEFKNSDENGYGKRVFNNGSVFTGIFKDGYIVKGQVVFEKYGFQIESDNWKLHDALSGTITYFEDNTTYIGEITDLLPHGSGIYSYYNRDQYNGNWKRGLPHGEGKYTFPDGMVYISSWKNGYIHGSGLIIYTDKRTNIGIWRKGKLVREIEGYKN